MGTSKTWPGGSANVTPANHTIPAAGELNWAALSNFLIDLADGAQCTTFQKMAVRQATSTPVTVTTSDCIVTVKLAAPAPVTVNLPAGANKQFFVVYDETGDASTNNITINANGSETIDGSASYIMDTDKQALGFIYLAADTDWKVIYNVKPNIDASSVGGLTASRAVVSDGTGHLAAATTTSTEIGYVNGVTSSLQNQLDNKQPLDADLTALAALASTGVLARTGAATYAERTVTAGSTKISVTNGDGVSGNPTIDATEANFTLDNIGGTLSVSKGGTSSTTALSNNRVMQSSGGAIVEAAAITASRALVSDVNGIPIAAAATTTTEIGYLNGVTSSVQTQIDGKQDDVITTQGDIIVGNVSGVATRLALGTSGYVLSSNGTTAVWTTSSAGDVIAAANMTDNTVVRGDGGGKGVQDSGVTLDDTNNMAGLNSLGANTITDSAGTGAPALTQGATFTAGGNIDFGTYTPTPTNITGVTAFGTTYSHQYTRLGSIVIVSGKQTLNSSSGNVAFTITLPISSTLSNFFEASGAGCFGTESDGHPNNVPASCAVYAYPATNTVVVRCYSDGAASNMFSYTFQYQII